jgi:hypothetical protein
LLIFNRPEHTARVFEEVRRARPPKLLVIADGPRSVHPEEAQRCRAARDVIAGVDWPCEVLTNYSEVNLGCKRRVASGLDWVFSQVEEAIILEDDCLPHPTFFRYCQELLERYRDDERVFHISGSHFRTHGEKNSFSYYFSRHSEIWGWASWRRAWRYYDVDMKLWPAIRDENRLESFLGDSGFAARLTREIDAVYDGHVDTWDCQWVLACWIHHGLTIRPQVNLVSNIGFGAQATHTRDVDNPTANLAAEPMTFPMRHPPFMMRDAFEDRFVPALQKRSIWGRTRAKLRRIVAPAHSRKLVSQS